MPKVRLISGTFAVARMIIDFNHDIGYAVVDGMTDCF